MIQSTIQTIKGEQVPVLVRDAVKLRRPNKTTLFVDLKQTFGFCPEKIIIQLDSGRNNSFNLIAIDYKGESVAGAELLKAIKKDEKTNI